MSKPKPLRHQLPRITVRTAHRDTLSRRAPPSHLIPLIVVPLPQYVKNHPTTGIPWLSFQLGTSKIMSTSSAYEH